MELLIGGQWVEAGSGRREDVTSPFDGSVVGTVSVAGPSDVEAALAAATEGAKTWRRTPPTSHAASRTVSDQTNSAPTSLAKDGPNSAPGV